MAIVATIDVIENQLWPQGDIRDPLGTWSARDLLVGDASGGGIKVQFQVPAARRRGRIYTAYHVMSVVTTGGDDTADLMKCRLLTNWPDADVTTAGGAVQGMATFSAQPMDVATTMSVPRQGPNGPLIAPQDRFILLFDPSVIAAGQNMVIIEVERDGNANGIGYAFEAYGYWWDRSVLNAPGGPRHPGSN